MNKPKNRFLFRSVALAVALVLFASTLLLIPADAADTSALGQLMDSFTAGSSSFTLSADSRFFIVSASQPSTELVQTVQLAQRQFAADGIPTTDTMDIVWGDASMALSGDILVVLDTASGIAAEGYQLYVTTKATVTAGDVDGMLYGLNMLQKHFRTADSNVIKGFTAADTPDTKERTVSLDFARKYYTKEWICNFIREMSWMGYNTLQLHLAEDSGFRMDIWNETYYKGQFQPANDFSWICGSENAYYLSLFSPNGVVQTDVDKDRYLTTAEMIEILETAKEYHIDVIPSFDSPGHMDYLTWKYEQNYLSNTGYTFYSTYYNKTYAAKDITGVINYTNAKNANQPGRAKPYFKAVNIKNEQAKAFVLELYTDIANFFKEYAGSTDFSICADEVVLNVSLATGYSYQFGYSDFVAYVNELNTHLNNLGYTTRAYNDYVGSTTYTHALSDFPDNMGIMYWTSDFNPGTGGTQATQSVYYYDGTLPLYNCLNTYTYYAQAYSSTASHPDCRCPQNTNWTMGFSTEEHIYNEWYPADFTARGKYSPTSDQIVDAQYVAGAYFLIWSDNPTLSTEQEIWNGFYSCSDNHLYVNLLDRMWSNTIKMWNWDLDDSVSFDSFVSIRDDGLNDFPGLNGCSNAAALPAATEPIALVSKATLAAALGTKLSASLYTQTSYAVYETAYDEALALTTANATTPAAQLALIQALETFNTAKAGLVIRSFTITVLSKVTIGGETITLDQQTHQTPENNNVYKIYQPPMTGYTFEKAEGSTFTELASGDGSGHLTGTAVGDFTITVWYRRTLDTGRLNALIAGAITSQGSYTDASWNAYTTALNNAKNLNITDATTQADINALANALEAARAALVTTSGKDEPSILIDLLNEAFPLGKQVGLRVTTEPNVSSLTVTDKATGQAEELTFCSAEVQTMDSGETVKIWLLLFPADKAGTFTYTVSNGSVSEEVTVVVG